MAYPYRPGVGLRQEFPQCCYSCRAPFRVDERIIKRGVLYEQERLAVGAWPRLTDDHEYAQARGRLLWAVWFCVACARDPRWRGYGVQEGTYTLYEPGHVEPARIREPITAERLYEQALRMRAIPVVGARSQNS